MLQKIRSAYIAKIIFSNAPERLQLNIIRYNKQLRKRLDIKIRQYKKLSSTFIVYETPVIGKQYNTKDKKLIFHGGFLHCKRNGEGKEFDEEGKLKFQGEYINGERNGKGKEFYEDGKIKYDGKYLDGERQGKGKELKMEN